MVICVVVGDIELSYIVKSPNPVEFLYHVYVQEFLNVIVLCLSYPVKFSHPVKDSMSRSAYLFKSNNINIYKSSVINKYSTY